MLNGAQLRPCEQLPVGRRMTPRAIRHLEGPSREPREYRARAGPMRRTATSAAVRRTSAANRRATAPRPARSAVRTRRGLERRSPGLQIAVCDPAGPGYTAGLPTLCRVHRSRFCQSRGRGHRGRSRRSIGGHPVEAQRWASLALVLVARVDARLRCHRRRSGRLLRLLPSTHPRSRPAGRPRRPTPSASTASPPCVNDDVVLESDVEEQLYLFLMRARRGPTRPMRRHAAPADPGPADRREADRRRGQAPRASRSPTPR